jgi:two-component system response regulator NreC
VVAEVSTLASFQKKVIGERPNVAVLDWAMACQDFELTTSLLGTALHATAFVFLTVSEDSEQKRKMLRLGARGFLSKWCTAVRLRTTVWGACQSHFVREPSAADVPDGDALHWLPGTEAERRFQELTQRERQVIPLVCSGLRNKEIAECLGISESTVWHHLTAVFTKLQVGDRMGLAAFAYSHQGFFPELQSGSPSGLGVPRSLSTHGLRPAAAASRAQQTAECRLDG